MNFSLYVVFEGSAGDVGSSGPAPLCRIADAAIVREAISRALDKAEKTPLPSDELIRTAMLEQRAELREILSLI